MDLLPAIMDLAPFQKFLNSSLNWLKCMKKMDKKTFLVLIQNMEKLKILSFKNQREILEFLFNSKNSNPLFTEDEKLQKIRNLIDYTDPSEKESAENS